MANSFDTSAIKRLKMVVTIVDKPKGEFYLDVLSQFEVNLQMLLSGTGTANSELVALLGLNLQKAVILSLVREDLTDAIMNCLEEKFATIKNGQGIAFAVPLSGVIGVNLYRFLINNRTQQGG